MASRRESRSAVTGAHTLQEFENLRRSFKASNDRLARKNNELLAQITLLNNQLQECAAENFRLRGEVSTLQRNASVYQARASSFERERQTMLDLMDEVNRANEWTRKNLTSLRRSFDLVDTPEPTTTASAQKPPTARQSIHSVVGVSKPPDMSRITEGGSESHGSPHDSPAPLNAHPPLSTLDARPTSMPAVKARDSLSLTYSDTPVAPGRRTVRRLSGRLSALDPTSHVRSSPPRSPPRSGASHSANVHKLIGGTEFMPELSPLAIQLDDDVANNAPHGKEKGRLRRKLSDFGAQSQRLDQPDSSLNDVTNASPTARKSTVMSTKEAAMDSADPVIVPPTSVRERQAKKPQLSTPSLAEDLLKHGSSSESSSRANRPANSVPAGSLAPPRSSKNRSSSPADPAGKSETEATSEEEGRERRVRKTINYAEPKLNTKMRKPDGWDSKNRKSLALTPVTNSAAPAQSSSSIQVSAGVTLRKHRPTSYPPAITVNQRSSSPLGDVDEPHSTVGRTYTSSTVPRKNLVDDLEDDGEASSYRSRLGERKEEMHLGVPKTSSKPTPRGEKHSNETEPNETWSVLSSDFAPSGLNTLARKRKTPSYLSSGPPAVTTSDDDDERASDDDGDEYVDNHRRATFKKNPSVRRQSGALSKRHL